MRTTEIPDLRFDFGNRTTGAKKLLDAAVGARELCQCDTAQLARLVQDTNGGAMFSWAFHRKGTVANWVRRDLEALLAPYATKTGSRILGRRKS